MGHKAKWEYFRAVYERYHKARREAKQMMLNEFCLNTGYHRKYAIRILNGAPPGKHPERRRRERRPRYGRQVLSVTGNGGNGGNSGNATVADAFGDGSVKDEVETARQRISRAAGVFPDAVRIMIQFGL